MWSMVHFFHLDFVSSSGSGGLDIIKNELVINDRQQKSSADVSRNSRLAFGLRVSGIEQPPTYASVIIVSK